MPHAHQSKEDLYKTVRLVEQHLKNRGKYREYYIDLETLQVLADEYTPEEAEKTISEFNKILQKLEDGPLSIDMKSIKD